MKVLTQKIETETCLYECDFCKEKYRSSEGAKECEDRHKQEKCTHLHLDFEYGEYCSGAYGKYSGSYVAASCTDCGAYLGRKTILKKHDKELQAIFKRFFIESPSEISTEERYWSHVTLPKELLKKK